MAFIMRYNKADLFQLAEDFGESPNPNANKSELKELIVASKRYSEDEAREALIGIETERVRQREREDYMKLELEKLTIEKMKVEAQVRISNSASGSQINDQTPRVKSLDEIVKMIKLLTVKVPNNSEGWDYFFSSLEKAFVNEKVAEEFKSKVLLCMLGEKVSNLLINLEEGESDNYEALKQLVLKEFEPSPKICLEKFREAKRAPGENFSQFASRLTSMWLNYCKLREANDFDTINQLIVADKIFQTLDAETATHIGILQGQGWYKPKELGKQCDIFYSSKDKPYGAVNVKKWESNFKFDKRNSGRTQFPEARRLTCFICGSDRHLRKDCPKNRGNGSKNVRVNKVSARRVETVSAKVDLVGKVVPRHAIEDKLSKLKKTAISVDGNLVHALIDSGTEITVIKKELVPNISVEGASTIYLKGIFGPAVKCPLVYVPIGLATGGRVNVVHQPILCALAEVLVEDVLLPQDVLNTLGGEEGVGYSPAQDSRDLKGNSEVLDESVSSNVLQEEVQAKTVFEESQKVVTSCGNEVGTEDTERDHIVKDTVETGLTASNFQKEQEGCSGLALFWKQAGENKGNYYVVDGYLFHREKILGESIGQLVVPECRREEVLRLAHSSVFGSHMGVRKTLERIRYSFFWEGLRSDVKNFCDSCEECQLTQKVKIKDRAPITPVVRPELPFQVVNVDLIGPIDPPSAKGHKYILCLVDQHTRWGEAIPLTSLKAKSTCEALLSIFSRTGIPNVIATDNGTNFASGLTKEFEKIIGSSPRFSTPGYPQSNGLVERFNQTLKGMLHNVIREEGRNWHLQIPYVLWAYREIPHTTTGVSPFQLLYGRQPQGPLSILKSTWTGKHNNVQLNTMPVSKYLEELKLKLERAAEQAKVVSVVQQERMAHFHNLRSSNKTYQVGDRVIVLIPDSTNKLFARWQGPGTIVKKINQHSFLVEMPDGSTKHIHQNKLTHFVVNSSAVNVIFEEEEEFGHVETLPTDGELSFNETLNELKIEHCDPLKLKMLKDVIVKFRYIFTKPVQPAKVGTHKIELKPNVERKKPHCYSVPIAYRKEVDRQIQELLDLNLIEPSESDISHPIVCVAKKDSSVRMCVDYRALNAVTKIPSFPMKDMQELIFMAGSAHWLTSLDLLKGYYQIPMDEACKPLTAFTTHNAVYQWKTMPFGLAGASGTFQREMNKILKPHSEYAQAYIDDIVIFSKSFEEHLNHLESVLTELTKRGLSIRLDKCTFAAKKIKYLGHMIGEGQHGPDSDKIKAIQNLVRPITKKDVRSVLGLMGFYRAYIPKYSEVATPLTELTKKNKPNIVNWGELEQKAFVKLKETLCNVTSLATPDANLPCQVHCDASDYGVGCCLTQRCVEGTYRPIAFASQKFTATQRNWSSIEKEAWAVLYGLNKFDKWIYGTEIEVISDHNPLKYLNQTTPKSPKLTRWALALQRWNYSITHRPGLQHRGADALSRLDQQTSVL